MQANPIIRLDDEHLVESSFQQFRCPAEIVVPYDIPDPQAGNMFEAYFRSRFVPSLWNMDSPWITAIFGTLFFNLLGFISMVYLREFFSALGIFGVLFSGFAASTLFAIPFTYMLLVASNIYAGYGKWWFKKLLGPTHIGVTELGFKLYVRGKFFYNYPNLAVWKDIERVDIVRDSLYGVPAVTYYVRSNYTCKNVLLPCIGFQSEEHFKLVLKQLFENVDKDKLSSRFIQAAETGFEPVLEQYRVTQSHVPLLE
jgi:hypothetical protein